MSTLNPAHVRPLPHTSNSGATTLPSALATGSSSKPRRTVRLFSQLPRDDSSSSDEEGIGVGPSEDKGTGQDSIIAPPSQTRQSSYPGATTSTTSRISAIVSSSLSPVPKLSRAVTTNSAPPSSQFATYPAGSIISSASSAQAPPPAVDTNGYDEWRKKYGPRRSISSRMEAGSTSFGKGNASRDHGGSLGNIHGRNAMDHNDPDSYYFNTTKRLHHLDDLGSDEDEGDARSPPKKADLPLPPNGINGGPDGIRRPGSAGRQNSHDLLPAINGINNRQGEANPAAPDTAEGKERLEWQSMLKSVLAGDILQTESSRIGEDRGEERFRRELGQSLWWQIRAKMRGRSEEEEKRRVEERRGRVVDAVLEEVESFVVRKSPGPAGVGRRLSTEGGEELQAEVVPLDETSEGRFSEIAALDQVTYILQRLSVVEALYPHYAALRNAKPLYNSVSFRARVDALTAWSTVVTSLQAQLQILRKWTGSDDLDITRPNTTKEKALVGKSRYHPLDNKAQAQNTIDQAADDSTFLERIMKEDNLQRTFRKRALIDLVALVWNARETVVSHLPLFQELQLPDFRYELVRLIGFPGRLVIEALKVRLDAAAKLLDPNPMVINDMVDNFRLGISIAVLIKKQYEDMIEPDTAKHWAIPPCLPADFDAVMLDGLRTFFKLLHWKLKSGSRTIYFRETEVLEAEWEFLYETAEAVSGGDIVVAEHFCSLATKLMVRVCNYFDSQLHVPMPVDASPTAVNKAVAVLRKVRSHPDGLGDRRPMSAEEMLVWYGKILDAVRMRYRKLQRFARRLTQRFDNSAEYALEDQDLDLFIQQLQESGHFLVYTHVFEERGTYIMADGSLWNDPGSVKQLLQRAFSVSVPNIQSQSRQRPQTEQEPVHYEALPELQAGDNAWERSDTEEDSGAYLLLLSPRQNFAWTGAVMTLDLTYIDFALDDNCVRLIADGPTVQLGICKRLFADALVDPDTDEPVLALECLVEQQAHLPRVQRELRKIERSNYRLSESFIESAAHVRAALQGSPGTQDMTENWFNFASEHGKRARLHIDPALQARFSRLLMRLGISWVSFICDSCDPTDRKTFRWTVAALVYVLDVTGGRNILHLDSQEFSLLRKSVASLVSLLISHFDVLGARSSMEAKRETERLQAMRRLQRLQENFDDDFVPRTPSPSARTRTPVDRSIRLVREERLRLIGELEQARVGFSSDQHLIGQVLDEQVSEDRALVFLAASSSNIALRWQQGAFIGGGANGNVYIGFNLDSGGIMAVKEIRVQDLSNSPTLYKQIKDESDVMSMLSHPNIVEYYGIEVHRDRVFIFQEYCEGGSLANLLEHGRVEDEDVVILYALQMLQGLVYLHFKGIEHRDVKPENILLGTNSTIKYVDFGAAKVIAKGNRTMAKTRAIKTKAAGGDGAGVMNSLAGTPMYMAPEVIRASEKAGQLGSADIWSMGCVLLEISTGRKPWSNLDNEWAIMFHIGIATQHPPLPEPGQLSESGIEFIQLCLTLDPSERPTAAELIYHPWLAPMLQQVTEHAQENALPGGPRTSSTLVDSYDQTAYANSLADIAKQDQNEQGGDPSSLPG